MQKTPIKKNSIIKKANKYSFKLNLILSQLTNKHNGINKVVNKIKNNEIPSTPIVKLILNNKGIHENLFTNWNVLTDLSKKTHNTNDSKKVKHEIFNAINLNKFLFVEGVITKKKAPNKGNNNIYVNKFLI